MSVPAARPLISPSFRLGLLGVTVAASALASVRHPRGLLVLALSAALAAALTRGAPRRVLLCWVPLVGLALAGGLLAWLAPTPPGAATWTAPWGGRPLSAHAVQYLANLLAKAWLAVTWGAALSTGLCSRDLLTGLDGLRLPNWLAALGYLTARGLAAVRSETIRLLRARDARGRARGLRAAQVAGAVAQTLVTRLGRRAEMQGMALVARGFEGRLPLLDVSRLCWAEGLALVALGGGLGWISRL